MQKLVETEVKCYHCGEVCVEEIILIDEKQFCCEGCKLVYEILNENNLCTYYNFNETPGISPAKNGADKRFAYLDDKNVKQKLLQFSDGNTASLTFFIPQMHCSSCIWLLENLNRINDSILRSRVDFMRKEVHIYYNENSFSLRKLVELLSTIGYEPQINLDDLEKGRKAKKDRSAVYRIGVAGFCFGNIMLFSFPEYFSLADSSERHYGNVFNYLNLVLSLPVLFYCSAPFFRFAFQSLKQKYLNIDVPIALGIFIMFVRSSYEIISATGAGYMDTMAGLTFFMLLGRQFQNKTYDTLSFDRDYKSFFPISVMAKKNGNETSIPVSDIKVGDRIIIRNEELIPADSILIKGEAGIDYSFVTGESAVVYKKTGELLYAGGKQKGAAIEMEVVKQVEQSYLTQLWNNDAYVKKHTDSAFQQLVNKISHYFTIAILSIALVSLAYWIIKDHPSIGWNAFTAVLIIACPCALAISSPFTLGNILRIFGKNKFYLKNYAVIEKLAKADSIVFDKTGTLTTNDRSDILFHGELSDDSKYLISSATFNSYHPLSRMIYDQTKGFKRGKVGNYSEVSGKGYEVDVDGQIVKIGSSAYVTGNSSDSDETEVHISIAGKYIGYFSLKNVYRSGVDEMIVALKKEKYDLFVISGDHSGERENLQKLCGKDSVILFEQTPTDKLAFIQKLQKQGKNVLMIGDGLNDAGALRQANVGISVSDNVNNFSPACDAIIDANRLNSLSNILNVSRSSKRIIFGSFIIALIYNAIGIYYAVRGELSPLFAAILMPISSVTIISFTTLLSKWVGRSKN
jgi:Cu+-exporting ATPase